MHYLQNHCWCSKSHWDEQMYDCRHIVSFNSYENKYKDDWVALVDPDAEKFFNKEEFDRMVKFFGDGNGNPDDHKEAFTRRVPNLKPHVLKWLEDNVKDRPDKDSPKGWCVGNSEYRSTNPIQLSIFFHRRKDALAFVKQFSKWKKPTFYCNYFNDERKYLNLKTLKYQDAKFVCDD